MDCYITRTGSFLPGEPIASADIHRYLGRLDGEEETREKVLAMNGITRRHYAQDQRQRATHDVYELAALAAQDCLGESIPNIRLSLLTAGTTYAPLAAPGIASILHSRLRESGHLNHPLEISSHAGVCTSASAALMGGIRAVQLGDHRAALCVAAEHASEILKSTTIQPIDDRDEHTNLRESRWFMSIFLRFMLSDGAGAFLLQDQADRDRLSLKVNWMHSMSFAHLAPLCMKLENPTALLSQDLAVLSKHLFPCADKFVKSALQTHGDTIDSHQVILPHMSSFFFQRKMERAITANLVNEDRPVPYWTNLATAGNTGAASIFVMLDEYLRSNELQEGQRLLLFVPESGQFNFVMISLTAVLP